jgi:hypothetical protein
MKMEKKFKAEKIYDLHHGLVVKNGKYYQCEERDGGIFLKQIDTKIIKEHIKISGKIADKIKDNLDGKKVIVESLMKLPFKEIKKLYRMLFEDKKTYTAKTREHRCVDMKIGNFILPIVE